MAKTQKKTVATKKKNLNVTKGKSRCAKVFRNKKNINVTKGKSSCAKVFQNVMNTAQNSKHTEFSLRRKSVELSDSLKDSIKERKRNNLMKTLEFKSCFIELSRVPGESNNEKPAEIKMTPKKKSIAIKKTKIVKSKPLKPVVNKAKPSGNANKHHGSIPIEIEQEINNYAKEALTLGWSLMKKNLPFFIQHCINKRELDLFSNGLKLLANNLPSSTFSKVYMRKYEAIYKDILDDKPAKPMMAMDEKNIFYFNLCWHLINKYAIRSESFLNLENKNRIFCCGDFSFASDIKSIVAITDGLTTAVKKKGENVFFCSSATGKVLAPLIINRGLTLKVYESSLYADNKYWQQSTEDGLMCAEAFHLWLISSLKPHLDEENIQRPVILFFNSDSPYLSIPVLDFCRENEIILFAIPCQFASQVNPLYMSCFDKLSLEYSQIFRKRSEETVGRAKEFCPLILIAAMDRINFNGCAQSAFEQSGLLKKESYTQENNGPISKKSPQSNLEDKLPISLKNSSYQLGKEVGKLMCYQEIMTSSELQLNTSFSTDAEKKIFKGIKKLYLLQSEKCTELLDYQDDSRRIIIQPQMKVKPTFKNTMTALNAENIFRVHPPQIIASHNGM